MSREPTETCATQHSEESLKAMSSSELIKIATHLGVLGCWTMTRLVRIQAILVRQEAIANSGVLTRAMDDAAEGSRIRFRHDVEGLPETSTLYEKVGDRWVSVDVKSMTQKFSARLRASTIACAEIGAAHYEMTPSI